MGTWEPINQNHAIDVMGVVIRFASGLPELLFRRALVAANSAAASLGLNGLGASQKFLLKLDAEGVSQGSTPPPGQIFSRRIPIYEDAEKPFKVVEQIQFDPESILYRTWDYVSWEWQIERIRQLFSPVLGIVGQSVVFEAIGVEYLDKFRYVGEEKCPPLNQLLKRDTGLVAGHIFEAASLFHSHTGLFVNEDLENPILQVVKVDASEADGVRTVQITTTEEFRYHHSVEENADPFEIFDRVHTDLKELLAKVITDEQAKRIYLQG